MGASAILLSALLKKPEFGLFMTRINTRLPFINEQPHTDPIVIFVT